LSKVAVMARRRAGEDVNGWVILDKPVGMTSTQAVARVKRVFHARKAGHAGTLDPLASGLLPVALGEATKTVPFVMDGVKTYRFTVRWGIETTTDDADGEPVATSGKRPSAEEVDAAAARFVGEISQVPPAFSAVKVVGERAYDLAREGTPAKLAPRPAKVFSLTHLGLADADRSRFEAQCGKGTYVRALARDMGRDLGCRGHVTALRRSRVGPFGEADMISLEMLEELRHSAAAPGDLEHVLRPVETALDDIPALAINRSDAARLRRGQAVLLRGRNAPLNQGTVYATSGGTLVALGEIERGELHPTRVFHLAG
jgi:tRNA pseudouridine55 synthase